MRTTAIMNLKGGVGKTATTVNMAAILAADYHKRVLVVDADSQANTTEFFGAAGAKQTLVHLLRKEYVTPWASLWATKYKKLSLIPADDSLMDLDLTKVEDETVDVNCLRDMCRHFSSPPFDSFDYVLIDCPPAFNAACAAALLAADDVVIPIKLDAFSLRGMANLMRQISNMRKINPKLKLAGLLPTMVYRSDKISDALEILQKSKLEIFPPIRKTNKVDDMTFAQEPLIYCSPKSAACVDYRRFVKIYVQQEKGGSNNA